MSAVAVDYRYEIGEKVYFIAPVTTDEVHIADGKISAIHLQHAENWYSVEISQNDGIKTVIPVAFPERRIFETPGAAMENFLWRQQVIFIGDMKRLAQK